MKMETKRSLVSAHHNYMVNGMLTPGFVLGEPEGKDGFYFLADMVLPGESTPRISGRFFDENGVFLFELVWNRLTRNPSRCVHKAIPTGFQVYRVSGETVLKVSTGRFPNGYLTFLEGRLFDSMGTIRMEQEGQGTKINGDALLVLSSPYQNGSEGNND
ncbi:MAG: hypothetical protein C4582_06035 [Desulfobacteraceae bacterium]|nr:MAG: hypothetical protein C4582_06035 [Desulfobacteraceae bacterium]